MLTAKRPCSCPDMMHIFNIINNKWFWPKVNTKGVEVQNCLGEYCLQFLQRASYRIYFRALLHFIPCRLCPDGKARTRTEPHGQGQQQFRVTTPPQSEIQPCCTLRCSKGEPERQQVTVTQHWLQLPGCRQAMGRLL